MMRHAKTTDLDWLAFCYVADELSPDEAAAFERQLAGDQAAREAVARAVELTRAVAAVGAPDRRRAAPVAPRLGRWRPGGFAGRLGWAAIAAAASLAVVLAYRDGGEIAPVANSPRDGSDRRQVEDSPGLPDRLAILWSQTHRELAAMQFDGWVVDLSDPADGAGESGLPSAADEADEDPYAANIPPSWMMAGVLPVDGGPEAEDPSPPSPGED